jgi:hypothetical protein
MKKIILIALIGISNVLNAQLNKYAQKYEKLITQQLLKEYLTVLASDEMEGRETATPGQQKAAAYIENEFKKSGLLPGNKNSYLQLYNVYKDYGVQPQLSIYNMQFGANKEVAVNFNNTVTGNWNINEVVFIGNGIANEEDIKNIATALKDKWVMFLELSKEDMNKPDDFYPQGRFYANPRIMKLVAQQVKGVLLVSKQFDKPDYTATTTAEAMYMKQSTAFPFPVVHISYRAAGSICNKVITNYKQLAQIPVGTYATNINLSVNKKTDVLQSSNVLAIVEGSDKKDEYVVLTAHYDHLGKRGDKIYYGADDDGSGTSAVMAMAHAFAKAKKEGKGPRRTIVFMAVSGEEKGLWGSEYYTQNPVFPLAKTTVNLNTDMVGRIDPSYKGDSTNYVYIIGDDKISSDLAPITDSINTRFKIELDRRYNDVKDPNRFYYRSDHYNFAKNGVPIIFYFNGVHPDYHKPSDTVDKINFAVMEKRVKFIFNTAWAMANRDTMLKRDKPLNVPPR